MCGVGGGVLGSGEDYGGRMAERRGSTSINDEKRPEAVGSLAVTMRKRSVKQERTDCFVCSWSLPSVHFRLRSDVLGFESMMNEDESKEIQHLAMAVMMNEEQQWI